MLRYRISAEMRGMLQRSLAECALTCLPDLERYKWAFSLFPDEKRNPRAFIIDQAKGLIGHDRHINSCGVFEQAWCDIDFKCMN